MWRSTSAIVSTCALLISAGGSAAAAEQDGRHGPTAGANSELNLLLLEVVLDNARLGDVLSGYESGDDILLPVGELARLLTIGITVDPATQTASGFVLNEKQAFRLQAGSGTVVLPGGSESYDPRLVQWTDGELYASASLLQRWWPIDFALDIAALRLNLVAREKLPLQARREREESAKRLPGSGSDSAGGLGYPYLRPDYDLLSVPFVDSTLALDLRGSRDKVTVNAAYTGFLTGDLLGMEAAAYLAVSREQRAEARITLARHDPDGGLLGPLGARSVVVGNVGVPVVDNVLRGAGVGNGVMVSNRPLSLPGSYRSKTLRGELPPGWDVTLYFNDALVGFQQARSDGLYEFPDQPLVYGRNEFRLVFSGPLGQTRVERDVSQLDQSLIAPGDFFYTAAVQHDDRGGSRQMLQADFSFIEDFGVTLGGVVVDGAGRAPARGYANAGARVAVPGAFLTLDYVQATDRGRLFELGVQTSVAGMAVDASRIYMDDFSSDFFPERADPVAVRDRLRMIGTLALSERLRLPLAFDLERERYASGAQDLKVQQRLSANVLGASFTNTLEWRSSAAASNRFGGVLQVSRRLAGFGLSGQAAYSIGPRAQLNSFALSAEKSLGTAGRAFVSVSHDLDFRRTSLSGGFNRNLGSFGVGISGMFAGRENYGLGLQLFTAIGRNPHSGRVASDWRPMAAAGMVAAQVFIDDNGNGIFDVGEDPVEGAAFKINGGSRHPARTDANGVILLNRLPPKEYVDIGLDTGTLEDAQLQPAKPGVRILPRPGKAERVDFPLVLTGEIDGTVFLVEDGAERGIGNAIVELLDASGKVLASTRSASDGFYVLAGVLPGPHRVRISPAQVQELSLAADGEVSVTMPADPDFISGIDLKLRK